MVFFLSFLIFSFKFIALLLIIAISYSRFCCYIRVELPHKSIMNEIQTKNLVLVHKSNHYINGFHKPGGMKPGIGCILKLNLSQIRSSPVMYDQACISSNALSTHTMHIQCLIILECSLFSLSIKIWVPNGNLDSFKGY